MSYLIGNPNNRFSREEAHIKSYSEVSGHSISNIIINHSNNSTTKNNNQVNHTLEIVTNLIFCRTHNKKKQACRNVSSDLFSIKFGARPIIQNLQESIITWPVS